MSRERPRKKQPLRNSAILELLNVSIDGGVFTLPVLAPGFLVFDFPLVQHTPHVLLIGVIFYCGPGVTLEHTVSTATFFTDFHFNLQVPKQLQSPLICTKGSQVLMELMTVIP